nr:hypothetical protein [Tanacetum cinerariifolium]
MSHTNNNLQTQTSNTLHNAIMEADSKDRPPMLAPDVQVPVSKGSLETRAERLYETYKNVLQDIRDQLNAEAEAVQIILTGIDNDIYSTVNACANACEMWKAIQRLKQGESLESYYSRFYKMMNELIRNQCNVTNHQVNIQFLLQLQPEWQRSQQAATRNRGKAIVNSPQPIYDQEPSMVADDDEMSKDKEIDKLMALISLFFKKIYKPTNNNLRTSSNTIRENQDNSPWINRGTGEQIDQHDEDADLVSERELLASLIEKLKCEIDERKSHNKFLETSNKVLFDKLKSKIEDFKNKNKSLELSINQFKEANNTLSETNNLLYADFKKSKAELKRRDSVEYASEMELECAKVRERSRLSHTIVKNGNSKESFNKQSTLLEKRMDKSITVDKQCRSSLELFKVKAHVSTIFKGVELCKESIAKRIYFGYIDPFVQNTIEQKFSLEIQRVQTGLHQFQRCLNEEMVGDLRYFNSIELEVDSLISQLETQNTQFLNEIDRLSREYYYADHMNAILGIYTEFDEVTNLQSQLQDKGITISELKKLIENFKGNSVDTKSGKSSVIRQPNAFKSERSSIFDKPPIFSNSLERNNFSTSKFVTKNDVSNDFSEPVTTQILPSDKKSILKNTNVLAPGMFKLHTDATQASSSQLPNDSRKTIKRVSFSTGVIPTTSVSRPWLKNPIEDRVMHNNSQGKKQEVEDNCRDVKFSKNKMSVNACNDSLNAKTSNVNFVCVTCGISVLNGNHDKCVRNDVNSKTTMLMAMPVSSSESNQSIEKPIRKTENSESNQKPRNTFRKLYERVRKTCKWWYIKFTPSGYIWKPKSTIETVNPNVSMPLGNASKTANVLDTQTSRCSTVLNTPLSSNSFATRRDNPIHRRIWVLKAHDGKSQAFN